MANSRSLSENIYSWLLRVCKYQDAVVQNYQKALEDKQTYFSQEFWIFFLFFAFKFFFASKHINTALIGKGYSFINLLGGFQFNHIYFKSIIDLITLNRFPKNHDLDATPNRYLTFFWLSAPFYSLTQTPETSANRFVSKTADDFISLKYTLQAVGVCLKTDPKFFPEK